MTLSDMLEEENFNVIGMANNGKKAIELARNNPVDLILSDINIKGEIDGIETVNEILKFKSLPIIYLTAISEKETLNRAKETHPAAYLNKPVILTNLLNAIELAIHNFRNYYRSTPKEETNPQSKAETETILQMDDYVFIKQNYNFIKVYLNDILFIKSDDSYITIQTTGKKYTLRLSLTSALERLNFSRLIKVHRSFAVNVAKVDSFNEHEITITQNTIPIARNLKDAFMASFKQK
ncbi:DNA-binding response regulator [Emticicia sp. C21]|nr:DNA-binding response regulator [Emticicia sp. C21]